MTYTLVPEIYRSFAVGFDDAFKKLDTLTKTVKTVGYPPYNIVKVDDNKYVIELAVAGFGKQDIEIELKENTLAISGKIKTDAETDYLYKGIADRAFTRTFSLADTVEIKNAQLMNGMLKVWLENIIPEHKKPRRIEVEETDVDQKLVQKGITETSGESREKSS